MNTIVKGSNTILYANGGGTYRVLPHEFPYIRLPGHTKRPVGGRALPRGDGLAESGV